MTDRAQSEKRETEQLRAFQRAADEISRVILNTDLPWVDIEIRIERLRARAETLFPGKQALFEMVYVSRFNRLRAQWRREEGRA